MLAPIPRDDAGALRDDEPAFLQLLHILPHGVVAHAHRLADGGVVGIHAVKVACIEAPDFLRLNDMESAAVFLIEGLHLSDEEEAVKII